MGFFSLSLSWRKEPALEPAKVWVVRGELVLVKLFPPIWASIGYATPLELTPEDAQAFIEEEANLEWEYLDGLRTEHGIDPAQWVKDATGDDYVHPAERPYPNRFSTPVENPVENDDPCGALAPSSN